MTPKPSATVPALLAFVHAMQVPWATARAQARAAVTGPRERSAGDRPRPLVERLEVRANY